MCIESGTNIAAGRAVFKTAVMLILALTAGCERQKGSASHGFQMADGCGVKDLSGIEEGYRVEDSEKGHSRFIVNVSAEHIAPYFERLITLVEERSYFVIEVPVSEKEDQELRKSKNDPFHNRVYYLDGIDARKAREIFRRYQRILVHDGLVKFGFGCHKSVDEVFFGRYKILTIFAAKPDKYEAELRKMGIPRREVLKTVRDTITEEFPGVRKRLDEKPTLWDMVEELKKEGLYLAETREEK